MTATQLFIDNEWVAGAGTFTTVNPATGGPLAECADAGLDQVEDAVRAARQALESAAWRDLTPSARGRILWRIGELVDEHADELASLETRDQGQPYGLSRFVIMDMIAEVFRYYAGWCTKLDGGTSPVSIPNMLHYTVPEPVGVCALITPWNFPMLIAAWKLAPALAAGNTVILKPAEQTPLTTLRLAELCAQAGVPQGVVNCLTGGPAIGAALVEHPGIDKVSFTGSTETGKNIVRASAGNLKRLSLELGGKAPSIIAADADIDAAVQGNLQAALMNSGQVCAAYARFYVDRAREDEFVSKMATAAASLRLGDGLAEGTDLGPLVSAEHRAHVDALVRSGREQGAEIVTGGRAPEALPDGYFYEPTVLRGIADDMRIAREEVFGPVIPVFAYDSLEEALTRANDSDFGLAASVWTRDLVTAHRTARSLRAGSVYVNALPVLDPAAPWGGFKQSGWGREMGRYAIDAFTETKGIWLDLTPTPS